MGQVPEEQGVKDGNDGMNPNIDPTETLRLVESEQEVHNVVPSNSKMGVMVLVEIARTMEQVIPKEISALVPESLERVFQCTIENARTGGCLVI